MATPDALVAADVHAVTAKWDPDSRDWVARCCHRDCGHLGHCSGVREVDMVREMHERAHPLTDPTLLPETAPSAGRDGVDTEAEFWEAHYGAVDQERAS